MSRLGWFAAGLGLGALAVIQLRDNPKAQVAVDDAILAAKEFANSVAEGYREQEKAATKKPAPKSTAAKK